MRKHLIALSALVLIGPCASAQQTEKPAEKAPQAKPAIPADAATLTNPVKPTPASTAQAKKTYGYDCAMCHGSDGAGKGDLAVDMKLKLPDYRDPASLKDKSDGELFYVIKNGKGDMPPEGERAKPDEIWNLVIYVRSFAKKEPTAKPKPDTP
ncbi:MAG TPA: c-type cytochrome [Candidatus Limnocylindria bacterium]|nr:c-type cytochrome [Candidatus Limnocylindria bacterium]